MVNNSLIVSNPPQERPDAQAIAPAFGLTAAEVRMKANYSVPEIWFADHDRTKISAVAETLSEAGFNVAILHAQDVAAVPSQEDVRSFSFSDSSLIFNLGGTELELAYNTPCIAVLCQPHQTDTPRGSKSASDSLRDSIAHSSQFGGTSGAQQSMHDLMFGGSEEQRDRAAFLDIFATSAGTVIRLALFQDEVDFSGLPAPLPNASNNLVMFVAEFEERFANVRLDRRLVGMRYRQRPTVSAIHGAAPDPRRKGYSYGSTALSKLLASISEELSSASQSEVSSRLAYLTTH